MTGDRRGRRGDAPLPGPWQLRDRLLAGLEVADSGTWTATHALPQRTVPARTGDNVVLSAGVDGAPGTLTYTLLVGRHPGLDPGLARAALARAESPAGRRGSSNPRRYALVGDGTCWDDGGWSHWLAAGAGGGGRYRLYRRPVGTARSGTAPELLATMAAAGLEAAVRDAVSGALRDGIALARLDAARDWRPLTPRVGGGRDGLADRVDVARQDAEAAARDLANAQADLRAAAGVAGSARAALVGNLTEAGRALDVASRRHGDLLAQVAARGPGGEPPDEFGCELDLLLAGLRLLGSGQPQAVRAVGALHDVLRLRLDPGDGAVAFAARVRVLADDGLVADLGPVLAEVPNRAHATGTRAGTGRRSRAEASRDNAERRARGRDRLDPAATERMMLTDDGPGELAALFRADRPGVGRPLGTGLRRRVLAHLAELGLHPRACRLVLDDPVQENRAEVWSALTGGPRAGGAYADWVVALYTAPGPPPGADPGGTAHLLLGSPGQDTPAGRAYREAAARLPAPLLRHLQHTAGRRDGHPLPRQNQWLRTAPAAQRALDRAFAGTPTTKPSEYVLAALLRAPEGVWPPTLLPGRTGSLPLPLPCPHGDCGPGTHATVLSRTATVTAGVLCPACLRMPVEGSPRWPAGHLRVSRPEEWAAWLRRRRPDVRANRPPSSRSAG